MKTSLFDFELPEDRIATHPVSPRDASRMLVVKESGVEDKMVRDLPAFLQPGDVMVFNDTKVIPARLIGKRGEVSIEITLLKALDGGRWRAFAKPGKRIKIEDKIIFSNKFKAIVKEKHDSGEVDLDWECDDFWGCLARYGSMPIPPYMKRGSEETDNTQYQTIYAAKKGAVAAPTAGLHFTDELLAAIDKRGVKRVYVTLHVGAGTFLPVKSEDTDDHIIHKEYIEISKQVVDIVNATREQGRRIIAVGTTSLRVLESAVDKKEGIVKPFSGETGIFITPGYTFKAVDILMTNFHLPKSTLFMLVSAFMGTETMKNAYRHAIGSGYRFYSYGDACLLIR